MATRYLKIDESFSGTKKNPAKIHSWEVWKNHKNQIVCLSHSRATARKVWVFPFEPGTIGFYNGTGNAYAYFRPKKVQDILDEFGITKISKENPNQVYRLRYAHYGGGRSDASIVTDGVVKTVDFDGGRTREWRESHPGTSVWESWETCEVTGATFVILEQSIFEGDNRSYAKILYTMQDIFSLKEKIRSAMNDK